jgi:hypothetical protein
MPMRGIRPQDRSQESRARRRAPSVTHRRVPASHALSGRLPHEVPGFRAGAGHGSSARRCRSGANVGNSGNVRLPDRGGSLRQSGMRSMQHTTPSDSAGHGFSARRERARGRRACNAIPRRRWVGSGPQHRFDEMSQAFGGPAWLPALAASARPGPGPARQRREPVRPLLRKSSGFGRHHGVRADP